MFTGKLSNISRAEAKSLVEKNSGSVLSTVNKKLNYLADGLSSLAEAVEHVSNTTPPIANVAFASSLLAKDLGNALEEQTQNIVESLKT